MGNQAEGMHKGIHKLKQPIWPKLLLVLPLLAGCDSGPPTGQVTGKVTYEGKSVSTGSIQFYPVKGGAPAVGSIKPDGTYTLARKVPGDGVLLGEYVVTIEAIEAAEVSNQPTSIEEEVKMGSIANIRSRPKYLVPEKYSVEESSDLTATVKPGTNEINFDLE